jgi:hypothetical protein
MSLENLPLLPPEQLPQTDEPKKRERVNCLQDMLLELMHERKISLATIQKTTGIPWPTLIGWHSGDVACQMADKNLLALARFFNVSLEYLVYGIGDDAPAFGSLSNGEAS